MFTSNLLGGTYEKVHKNGKNACWGGVLVLSAILALSLMFASCSNSSDSDDENFENPSPSLPENVGENPVKETIKLKHNDYATLEMKADGTADYYDDDELEYVFKYTWNTTKQEIYMAVGKKACWSMDGKSELLTYEQMRSKINEDYTVEKMRQYDKTEYEKYKEEDRFKKKYPGCNTYEEWENAFLKEYGYGSYDDYVKSCKQEEELSLKATFGALITFSYKITNGKITLTEKFTGVKNFLLYETCRYNEGETTVTIESSKEVSIKKEVDGKPEYWNGEFGAGNSIEFEKEDSESKKTGSYTENIDEQTVTINFDGRTYVCKFEEKKFIQVDE